MSSRSTGEQIVVRTTTEGATVYPLTEVHPLQPGDLHQPAADRRERRAREAGEPLADSSSTDRAASWRWARTCWCAFMSWEGYNFEDAIILSERLVRDDKFTSIHIEKHEVEARDTKLGPRRSRATSPTSARRALRDLDEDGIIRIGAEVQSGRHPRRQDHAEGRDRADGRGEAAARDLRREGARGEGHLAARAARRARQGDRRQASSRATSTTSCRPASTSWCASRSPRSARSPRATRWPAATATRA